MHGVRSQSFQMVKEDLKDYGINLASKTIKSKKLNVPHNRSDAKLIILHSRYTPDVQT